MHITLRCNDAGNQHQQRRDDRTKSKPHTFKNKEHFYPSCLKMFKNHYHLAVLLRKYTGLAV